MRMAKFAKVLRTKETALRKYLIINILIDIQQIYSFVLARVVIDAYFSENNAVTDTGGRKLSFSREQSSLAIYQGIPWHLNNALAMDRNT